MRQPKVSPDIDKCPWMGWGGANPGGELLIWTDTCNLPRRKPIPLLPEHKVLSARASHWALNELGHWVSGVGQFLSYEMPFLLKKISHEQDSTWGISQNWDPPVCPVAVKVDSFNIRVADYRFLRYSFLLGIYLFLLTDLGWRNFWPTINYLGYFFGTGGVEWGWGQVHGFLGKKDM